MLSRHLLIVLILCSWSASFAQEAKESVNPGINAKYLDPNLDVNEWIERFEVETREVFSSRVEVVESLKLQPGDRIADIGTGTGLYVQPFAKAVGEEGWVYAIDIAPKFVERIRTIAEVKGLKNVTPVLGSGDDIRLPPGTIDAGFICDVYHHFEYPDSTLTSIFRAIKPGGQLVVIDFERIPGVSREWILGHVRAGKSDFRKEIEGVGFEFVEEVKIEGFEENYFLRFRRP